MLITKQKDITMITKKLPNKIDQDRLPVPVINPSEGKLPKKIDRDKLSFYPFI